MAGKDDIKLSDFLIAKKLEKTHASTYAGTPHYMSPEVFKTMFMDGIAYYPNTDIW